MKTSARAGRSLDEYIEERFTVPMKAEVERLKKAGIGHSANPDAPSELDIAETRLALHLIFHGYDTDHPGMDPVARYEGRLKEMNRLGADSKDPWVQDILLQAEYALEIIKKSFEKKPKSKPVPKPKGPGR